MTWEKHKQVLTPVTRSYGIAVMGMGFVIGLFTAFALAGTAHSGGVLLLLIPAAIFLNLSQQRRQRRQMHALIENQRDLLNSVAIQEAWYGML